MSENRLKIFKTVLIVVALVAIVLPITSCSFYFAGEKSGVEFSPTDFTRRRFRYNKIPFVDVVTRKRQIDDITPDLETSLIVDGLITTEPGTKRWDLVNEGFEDSGMLPEACDARFLVHYLDLIDDDDNNFWIKWNEKYPQSAKVFWPAVAEMARSGMYLKIPLLMKLGMSVESDQAAELQERVDELLGQIYLELGMLDFDLGNLKRAKTRIQRAGELDASDAFQAALQKINKIPVPTTTGTESSE